MDELLLVETRSSRCEDPKDGSSQLPWQVRFMDLVLFGGGRFWIVPLVYSAGSCVSTLLLVGGDQKYILSNVTWSAEICVNAYFGYHYCRARRVSKLISEMADQHGISRENSSAMLRRCCCASTILGIAYTAFDILLVEKYEDWSLWHQILDGLGSAAGFFPVFHLCSWWLWTNWVFWCAGKNTAHLLTVQRVASRQASESIFCLLDSMREISQIWSVNHGIRALTTMLLGVAWLKLAASENGDLMMYDYSTAMALFVVVWITAMIPGYVTTSFNGMVLRTLTKIASGDDPSFRGQTDLENQTANLDSPTSLMQRISAAASVTGMHFAGVPMTVQKAVSVGSVVFYVASSWQRSF
jgi:hypothetical protein